MGLWARMKGVRNKKEPDKADAEPDDVPEMPQPAPTSQPKPAEPEPAEPEYQTYTVRSGDTLSAIGQAHGVDWRDIAELNNLENPDLIFPGQVFKIPHS